MTSYQIDPYKMTELEYAAHLIRLQKSGELTKLEALQQFGKWKKKKNELHTNEKNN